MTLTKAQTNLLAVLEAGGYAWCHDSVWTRAGLFHLVAVNGDVTNVRHSTVRALVNARPQQVEFEDESPNCHDVRVVAVDKSESA